VSDGAGGKASASFRTAPSGRGSFRFTAFGDQGITSIAPLTAAAVASPGDGNGAPLFHLIVAQASQAATLPSVVPVPVPSGLTHSAGRYFEEDVVADGIAYRDGALHLSGKPGLGVDVDVERVERLAIAGRRLSSLAGG
jgi:L-alanine-DL-glutamate epimerase-like enolase superfamily enzyme